MPRGVGWDCCARPGRSDATVLSAASILWIMDVPPRPFRANLARLVHGLPGPKRRLKVFETFNQAFPTTACWTVRVDGPAIDVNFAIEHCDSAPTAAKASLLGDITTFCRQGCLKT